MITVLLLCVALVFCRWLCRRRLLELAARMPGPPAWPVLGNALVFMARPEEILNIIGGYFDKYGQYVRFWLGPDLQVCIKNPEDIKMLLTSNKINQKGPLYEFMKPLIGPGILSGGPAWRNHRKIATPSYNKKCVSNFSQIFNREAKRLVDVLAYKDPNVTFDVYFDVVETTTQCVCQTLMGLSEKDSKNVYRMEEVVLKTQTLSQEASAKIAAAVLLFLAYLPDWQEKVYNEIVYLLGDEDYVTEEQLKKLQALDMVYKETLRYMSIAAFIQRTVEEEVAVKNGELVLPRGASIIIPIHMVHRDSQYWSDPYKVDPGRFSADNVRPANAFVPFSLGNMDCLGRVYATSLVKTLVVHCVRRLQLSMDGRVEDLPLNVAISVKFQDGYNLRVRPRKTVH